MVRLTRIYTRGGDAGETSLGDGRRVPKHDLRVGQLTGGHRLLHHGGGAFRQRQEAGLIGQCDELCFSGAQWHDLGRLRTAGMEYRSQDQQKNQGGGPRR